MRRAVLVATLAAAAPLAGAAPAPAQLIITRGGDEPTVRTTDIPVRPSGEVVVHWRSADAEGTFTWRLPPRGDLTLIRQRAGGRPTLIGHLSFAGSGLAPAGGGHAATRVRRGAALCADTTFAGAFAELENDRGRMELGLRELGEFSLLRSRCAGPLFEDVQRLLPVVRIPAAQLRRGRMRVRLAADSVFETRGISGTVRSTLSLALGAPRTEGPRGEVRDRTSLRRERLLSTEFRVVSVTGEIGGDVAGAADRAACAPLDSCGLTGTLRLAPRAREGEGFLNAFAERPLPRSALRAAVGLGPGGRPPHVLAFGGVSWEGEGTIETALARDGEPACADSATLAAGALQLTIAGTRVRATYEGGLVTQLRTRCPGPLFDLGLSSPLAAVDVPLTDFGRRRVELRLTQPQTLLDDGWSLTTRPALTVVLERVR